jgi:hypothetical protein
VSALNVENVVKPPQKPGIRSARRLGESGSRPPGAETANRTPIRKLPMAFTANVAQGKAAENVTDREYRSTPPMALPSATATKTTLNAPAE